MNCREIKPHLLLLTAAEQSELGKNPLTAELRVEAAMCAWEHLLERYRDNPDGFDDLGGTGQARMLCAELAPAIHYGYHVASVDDRIGGHSFDWDFVPWFLDNCVVWDSQMAYVYGHPDLVDDWVEKCRVCLTEPEPELSDEDLLTQCLIVLNSVPNYKINHAVFVDTYTLAAMIDRRLKA